MIARTALSVQASRAVWTHGIRICTIATISVNTSSIGTSGSFLGLARTLISVFVRHPISFFGDTLVRPMTGGHGQVISLLWCHIRCRCSGISDCYNRCTVLCLCLIVIRDALKRLHKKSTTLLADRLTGAVLRAGLKNIVMSLGERSGDVSGTISGWFSWQRLIAVRVRPRKYRRRILLGSLLRAVEWIYTENRSVLGRFLVTVVNLTDDLGGRADLALEWRGTRDSLFACSCVVSVLRLLEYLTVLVASTRWDLTRVATLIHHSFLSSLFK